MEQEEEGLVSSVIAHKVYLDALIRMEINPQQECDISKLYPTLGSLLAAKSSDIPSCTRELQATVTL